MTPGPWHLSKSGLYVRKSDGPDWPAWNICEMNTSSQAHEADAHLIAAAPDLLEACRAVLEAAGVGMDDVFDCSPSTPVYDDCEWFTLAVVDIVRAAIARAEGRS